MAEQTTQNWWQTLPGIMTAAAGCVSAITAMIIALHQAGLFKSEDKSATVAPVAVVTASPENIMVAAPPAAGARKEDRATNVSHAPPASTTDMVTVEPVQDTGSTRLGALDDKALLLELEHANVGYSVDKTTMMSWLADDDRTFRRVSRASARLLNGKRLKGNAPDLDVIKYHYLQAVGLDGGGQLAVDAHIDDAKLRQAIIAAFNDKNGTSARRMEGIVEAR